jgi:hypothetical protein
MPVNLLRASLLFLIVSLSFVSFVIAWCAEPVFIKGDRYDFFKAELLKTRYFEDNIICHFTASFAAVRFIIAAVTVMLKLGLLQGTVATTVCSPADVLKVCSSLTRPLG